MIELEEIPVQTVFTPEQQKANRELWFKELETTTLPQGTGALCANDKYCCLGIACEVAMKNGLPLEKELWDGFDKYAYKNQLKESDVSLSYVPIIVKNWLGLYSTTGLSWGDRKLKSCVDMNDNDRKTFKEIAQHLRANEKAYFICD